MRPFDQILIREIRIARARFIGLAGFRFRQSSNAVIGGIQNDFVSIAADFRVPNRARGFARSGATHQLPEVGPAPPRRVKQRKAEKSILLTGLRGGGKTVLLNEIERMASGEGYQTLMLEAHEDKPLGMLVAPYLRSLLYDLTRMAGALDKVKRALAVLRSFVGAFKVKIDDATFGLDIEPEKGSADSGDLEIDLPNLLVAVGEAAESRGRAVTIFIDEIQYFGAKELGALIMAMHKIQQKQLPLV